MNTHARIFSTDPRPARPAPAVAPMLLPPMPSPAPTPAACACGGGCPRCAATPWPAAGRPLSDTERATLSGTASVEHLQRIRVHDDAATADRSAALRARAFAVGTHIGFGRGQLAPDNERGRRLLRHEIAHTVQQAGADPAAPLDAPSAEAESEAHAFAHHPESTSLTPQGAASLQCDLLTENENATRTPPFTEVMHNLQWKWAATKQSDPENAGIAVSYEKVAPTLLRETEARGIGVAQGLFLMAQAIVEEVGNTRNPAGNSYRVFNMMPFDWEKNAWRQRLTPQQRADYDYTDPQTKAGRKADFRADRGISLRRLPSAEVRAGGRVEVPTSPFFHYTSLRGSVNHLLDRLGGEDKTAWYLPSDLPKDERAPIEASREAYRKQGILKVLRTGGSKIGDYTSRLKAIGYATAPNYAKEVNNRYRRVLMDFIAMLDDAAGKPSAAVESSEEEENVRASVAYYRSILRGQLDTTPEMK